LFVHRNDFRGSGVTILFLRIVSTHPTEQRRYLQVLQFRFDLNDMACDDKPIGSIAVIALEEKCIGPITVTTVQTPLYYWTDPVPYITTKGTKANLSTIM
jgi:hypothetical protein